MATIASLIIDVAANTANLQRDVQQINSSLDGITSAAGKMAGALGISFSIGSVVAFAREVASFASDMEDASAKTGIGVEQLQALNYAAVGAGVSIDQIAGAMGRLSKGLVDGDSGAARGVERLGLNVQELLNMDPAEAFLEISERIAGIENPMRQSAAAIEIFGKSGAELLPAMKEDLRGLMEQANATGSVMDRELIRKAGEFDDAWDRGLITLKSWGAQLLELGSTMSALASPTKAMVDSFGEFHNVISGLSEDMVGVVDRLDRMHNGALAFVPEVDNLAMSTYALKKAEQELDEQDRRNTQARKEHTKAVEDAARAHRDFVNWVGEREIEAVRLNNEAMAENAKAREEWRVEVSETFLENNAAMDAWVDKLQENFKRAELASEQWERAMHDDMARNEHSMIAHTTSLRELWDSLGTNMVERTTMFMDQIGDFLGPKFKKIVGGFTNAWGDGQKLMKGIGEIMMGDFSNLIGTMQAGISLVKAAWGGLKGLFSREVEHANDTRDQFILSNWQGGGAELAALLTSLGAGDGGGDLYRALIGASDVAGVNDAKAAIERFLHDNGVQGFAMGTMGQFMDFGAGTPVVLHGRERVVTESEGRSESGMAGQVAALQMTIAALVADLPNQIQAAVAIRRGMGLSRASA